MSTKWELGGRRLHLYLFASVAILFLVGMLLPASSGSYWWVQRKHQRKVARERVQAFGGWDALIRDCRALAAAGQTNTSWFRNAFDSLSNSAPTVVSLDPQWVEIRRAPSEPSIVRIKLFGAKSSGARGSPPYSLWVVGSQMPSGYVPKPERGTVRQITNAVFEVY